MNKWALFFKRKKIRAERKAFFKKKRRELYTTFSTI